MDDDDLRLELSVAIAPASIVSLSDIAVIAEIASVGDDSLSLKILIHFTPPACPPCSNNKVKSYEACFNCEINFSESCYSLNNNE